MKAIKYFFCQNVGAQAELQTESLKLSDFNPTAVCHLDDSSLFLLHFKL